MPVTGVELRQLPNCCVALVREHRATVPRVPGAAQRDQVPARCWAHLALLFILLLITCGGLTAPFQGTAEVLYPRPSLSTSATTSRSGSPSALASGLSDDVDGRHHSRSDKALQSPADSDVHRTCAAAPPRRMTDVVATSSYPDERANSAWQSSYPVRALVRAGVSVTVAAPATAAWALTPARRYRPRLEGRPPVGRPRYPNVPQ